METPIKVKLNLVLEAISSLFDTAVQYLVDKRLDHAVEVNTKKTIVKCIQYNSKFYMIQESTFKFKIFRRADIGPTKTKITFKELQEAAIFVAYPEIHNLKNYTENGKKRK